MSTDYVRAMSQTMKWGIPWVTAKMHYHSSTLMYYGPILLQSPLMYMIPGTSLVHTCLQCCTKYHPYPWTCNPVTTLSVSRKSGWYHTNGKPDKQICGTEHILSWSTTRYVFWVFRVEIWSEGWVGETKEYAWRMNSCSVSHHICHLKSVQIPS